MNAALSELLLVGAAGSLSAVGLGDLVQNALGVTLDAPAIESRLGTYGLSRAHLINAIGIAEQVNAVTEGWASSIQRELLQPTIARTEADRLVDLVNGPDKLLLLMGHGGGGKSASLQQVYSTLDTSAVSVLAFRLDRLDPFSSTTELGNRIGLEVSPVTALAAVSGERPSLLIVDQLDAVSLASGRMPDNFQAVADLVREASAFPNMTVVFACRKFDVENDHRIRELVDAKRCAHVEVSDLSEQQVIDSVRAMGLDAAALNERQKKLLRSPLHLVLLKGIAGDEEALTFQTTKNLFDAFWRRKLTDCIHRRNSVRFNKVISTLAEAVSARQRLSVPITALDADDLSVDADVLVSEHILVRDGQQIAFFHETFFDYAFARGWIERNQSLVEFLLSGEQELFRRAQVRQIMNHLRELEPERFTFEVESVLTSTAVRYHIKDVVLKLLGFIPNPSAREWEMVATVQETHPDFEARLWRTLQTPSWFECLDAEGIIDDWLSGTNKAEHEQALGVMAAAAKVSSDRLAEILHGYKNSVAYPRWLQWVTRFSDIYQSRPLFELLLEAVRIGQFAGSEDALWLSAHDLGKQRPDWTVELLAAYLVDRPGAMAVDDEGKVVALLDQDYSVIQLVQLAAAGAPDLFCERLIPYMLQVMAATAYEESDGRPIRDRHFSYRHPGRSSRQLEGALLAGAVTAIRNIVERDAASVRPILESLTSSPHDTAQWLAYETLRAAGSHYAEWAGELLLQGNHRFISGYYAANAVWKARELIQSTSQFMSDEMFSRLEGAILEVRFPWNSKPSDWHQFNLLSALEEDRLSPQGRRRLGELRRKIGADQPAAPQGIMGGFIGAPISQAAAAHMNDEQWLSAMAKHNSERTDWQTNTGGAYEQSHVLHEQTKREPERFSRLALRFDDTIHPAYSDAILMGLGEAEALADPTAVFQVVRHIASFGQPANDRWLGSALRKYLRSVPEDIFRIILDRATSAGDPVDGSLSVQTTNQEHTQGRDLYTSGINSSRGSAAEVLGDLIIYDTDGSRTALVLPALDGMAEDPAITVRSCVAHLIHASMRHARPEALRAFTQLINTDDSLLATHTVVRLIAHIGFGSPDVARPVIERMLHSNNFETRKSGGQLAALAAMQWSMPDLLDSVLSGGDVASRTGAANSCAQGLSSTADTVVTLRAFEQLINDPEHEVRQAIAEVASVVRGERLRPLRDPLTQLISSASFEDALPQLLISLEHAPDRVDYLALECARRFVEIHGQDAGDIRTRAAADARHVGELLIRAYAQATSISSRTQILDLLDQLLLIDAYGVANLVETAER
ncbi:NACHT domain-containing protein [Streptomyces ipomoeae]